VSTEQGGLDISIVMADVLPTEKLDPSIMAIELHVTFDENEKQPGLDSTFLLVPKDGAFSSEYAPPGEKHIANPNPGFTVEFRGVELVFHIAPELTEDWPESVGLQFRAFYWPDLEVNSICADFVPSPSDWVSLPMP
jgi:hypothetical protein